ncbi:alcohol dehydrogenase-like domain-containing protein [Stagonosporopsis vannaccii]|nr:alcohol dehydrogenase-like domain-containing protein [Stagonosporopsis vannaccii]
MRAVVFKGPDTVAVEERPVPTLRGPKDAILKVTYTALCGSDLHYYRGHQKIPTGFIVGHEFTGIVTEIGDAVTKVKVGDKVVVPFSTACGECYYCERKQSSRCENGLLFGNSAGKTSIDGGQAQYVRVPYADGTLVKAPSCIPDEMLVLMADIFPTGYFAASRYLKDLSPQVAESTVAVVIGCGPVGICAIASALTMVKTVYAIDPNSERLAEAERLGAKPIPSGADAIDIMKKATNGRGADVVMEVVGKRAALLLSLDLVRPWGYISSVGIHSDTLDLPGPALYAKNVTLAMGRCPVRSIFEDALAVLVQQQDKVRFLTGSIMNIEAAEEAFRIFESGKVHKIIFDMTLS